MLSFFQRHYGDEDPEKEQKVKEIERLLMATENELKIKPSLSVSKDVCLGVKLWQHDLCECISDPGFEDGGRMCVFMWIRRRKHLGGLFLQKWWNRALSPFLYCVCDPLCNFFLLNTSVAIWVKVPFLLLFVFLFKHLHQFHFLHVHPFHHHRIFLLQMNLNFPAWTTQSSVISSSDDATMNLSHLHTAAPALPLDQSCLPEESASSTRSSSTSSSHHSSPTFLNSVPDFMESVIDSVSFCFAVKKLVPTYRRSVSF